MEYDRELTKEEALQKIEELKMYIESRESDSQKILDYAIERWNSHFTNVSTPEIENHHGRDYIKLPLPTCNRDWTFFVWNLAKELRDEFNVCPYHYGWMDSNNYVYLKVNKVK